MKQFNRSRTELIWLMLSFIPLPLIMLYELVFGHYFDPWLEDPLKSMLFNVVLTVLCITPIYIFFDFREVISVEADGLRLSGGLRKRFILWKDIRDAYVSDGFRRTIIFTFQECNALRKLNIGFFIDKEDMETIEEEIKKICGENIKWSFKKISS